MTTILLTGFEPFDGADRDPSGDAVSRVAAEGRAAVTPERVAVDLDDRG